MANIRVSHEKARGCGYRKGGGTYLIGGDAFSACGKLPYPLKPCEHCGEGLRFFRGFRWINPQSFIDPKPCVEEGIHSMQCTTCSMSGNIPERAGLMWVGKKFYSPESFLVEVQKMGLSKRLSTIPKELLDNLGTVRVYLMHPEACTDAEGKPAPGIFCSFVPRKIEYVVRGDETEEELERKEKRGIELVKVVPEEETTTLEDVATRHAAEN